MAYNSETSKHRNQLEMYCRGNGLDIGSSGDPIVATALQIDLEKPYSIDFGDGKAPPIQFRGDATNLYWFRDNVLDYVYSSHLLEDFLDWTPVLHEWCRVVKPGGHLVILMPEIGRWKEALDRGQPPNLAHKHEAKVGELTEHIMRIGGFEVIEDRFADETDYGLIFVAKKRANF